LAAILLGIVIVLGLLRHALLRRDAREPAAAVVTWGCGYSLQTSRMQYTAASFAEPLLEPFSALIHTDVDQKLPAGPFPRDALYVEHIKDMAGEHLLVPAVRRIVDLLGRIRVLQAGRIQVYLIYIAATLMSLLGWQVVYGGR
jgi:hypothetical protein